MHSLWCARFILWLPNYSAWKETNKIMASTARQVDKVNLSEAHRLDELLFFTYLLLHGNSFPYRSLFICLWWPQSLHHKFIFCFERKRLLQKCWSGCYQQDTLFSSGVSQQFQYFHKSFLNKLRIKKETWIKSGDKALRSPILRVSTPKCCWSMTLWGNSGVSSQPPWIFDQAWKQKLLASAGHLSLISSQYVE